MRRGGVGRSQSNFCLYHNKVGASAIILSTLKSISIEGFCEIRSALKQDLGEVAGKAQSARGLPEKTKSRPDSGGVLRFYVHLATNLTNLTLKSLNTPTRRPRSSMAISQSAKLKVEQTSLWASHVMRRTRRHMHTSRSINFHRQFARRHTQTSTSKTRAPNSTHHLGL